MFLHEYNGTPDTTGREESVLMKGAASFRGWLGNDKMSLLQRCSHSGVRFGKDEVSLLERCSHFRGYIVQCKNCIWGKKVFFIREVSCVHCEHVGVHVHVS